MNKVWYIQTMKYYSALKRNELSTRKKTGRNHKCILLSGRSQFEKATYCIIPAICHYAKGKTIQTIKRSVIPGVGAEEEMNRASAKNFLGTENTPHVL